jgi:D-tyrosyl-tRNA(Tyr) deacylase
MRALLQRVSEASVEADGRIVGTIQRGLVVFLGISKDDGVGDAAGLADKVVHLRIFPDTAGKMNRSLLEAEGSLLVISQFTLYGDCRKGRRPSFDEAARPEQARALYEQFVSLCRAFGVSVETGIFQAMMRVHLVNDGPVTFLCESIQSH